MTDWAPGRRCKCQGYPKRKKSVVQRTDDRSKLCKPSRMRCAMKRDEEKRQEWIANGMYLTRAELAAGVRCRGCGLPIVDGLGDRPPLSKMSDDERRRYDANEAEFQSRHPACRAHRWSIAGSHAEHCDLCCPPPPLSVNQIERILTIFEHAGQPDPDDLDTWRLTLTCGHISERSRHRSNTYWSGSTTLCPGCEQTRGIVTAEKLPPSPARNLAEERRAAAELEIARREFEKLQKKSDAAQRRLTKFEAERDALRS